MWKGARKVEGKGQGWKWWGRVKNGMDEKKMKTRKNGLDEKKMKNVKNDENGWEGTKVEWGEKKI